MNPDDIMPSTRLKIQHTFMINHPDAAICGGSMRLFNQHGPLQDIAYKKCILWIDFIEREKESAWIMSYPTLCFKKSALSHKDDTFLYFDDDNDIIMKLAKKFGSVYNMSDLLLYFRVYEDELINRKKFHYQEKAGETLIDKIIEI